ncbi:MAG: AtpZ/AtpI family protein [Smithellaceae bacterium]
MLATHTAHREQLNSFSSILMLSAWGFAMVIASFLFLYVGHLLDEILGTSPNFMLGLFFLAIFLCVMRLYQEAWKQRKVV